MSILRIDSEKNKTFSFVGWYTLGLVLVSVAIQVSKKSLLPNSNLQIDQLLIFILVFGFGLWIGYTWHSVRLERKKKTLLWESLTLREKEVANLLISGSSNQQICDQLFIGNNTVKTHLRNIYKKSQCNGRKEFSDKFYL